MKISNSKKARNVTSLVLIIVMVVCFVIICVKLWYGFHSTGDPNDSHFIGKYHNMGDAIGGTTAPLIGILSSILIFLSFQQQIRANEIIMETRKEDNMSIYLKDNIERMEAKYAQVAERCSEFISTISPMGVVTKYEENLKVIESKGKYGADPRYKMPDLERKRVNSAFLSIEEKKPVLDGLLGLLKFCTMYYKYLFANYTDKLVSVEMKNIIEVYISEYTAFVGMNLRNIIVKIEGLSPYITIEEEYNKDLAELVSHAETVNRSTQHLEAVVDFKNV